MHHKHGENKYINIRIFEIFNSEKNACISKAVELSFKKGLAKYCSSSYLKKKKRFKNIYKEDSTTIQHLNLLQKTDISEVNYMSKT